MIRLFLHCGQSNSQGYGNRTQLTPVPSWAQTTANGWEGQPTASADSGVQYPHPTLANSPSLYVENNTGLASGISDGWGSYDGCNPAFGTHPGEQGSYGPELAFLARWRADHPGEGVACIKCVLGGSSLADWLPPNGSMWAILQTMIAQAKARLASTPYVWSGLLWMQGESGASTAYPYLHPMPGQEYSDQLRVFLAAVRSLTSPSLPVALGRIGDQMLHDDVILPLVTADPRYSAEQYRAATNYRRHQQEIVAADPGNALWSEDGLPRRLTDAPAYRYHHTGAGYLAAGERAYAAWLAASGEVPPPPPAPLTVRVSRGGVLDPTLTATVTLNGAPVGAAGDVLLVDLR